MDTTGQFFLFPDFKKFVSDFVRMLDEWIEQLKKGSCISESDLKGLCYIVKNILMEEANVQAVKAPVTVSFYFTESLVRARSSVHIIQPSLIMNSPPVSIRSLSPACASRFN